MGDDEALVGACRAGDDRAWQTLVDRYVRLVFAVPINFGLSPADAEDVAQTTFSILLASLDKITDAHRIGAWLVTVARRQTWRYVERQRREAPREDIGSESGAIQPDDGEGAFEDLQWVHQGLLRLGPRCRDLLTALYFQPGPRPYTDVARELGVPLGSIGPTRARCLERLRAHLEDLRQT